MSIIRPPISGDSPQDSWANQVTEAINKGLLAPSINPSEATVISVGSFSAATVYLYTRTTTATAPAVLTQDLTYDYSQASFTTSPPFGSANWETSPPGTSTGDYLWIITVNISANVGQEIIPAASWSTPQIFSVNGSSSIVIEAYLRASSAPSTPTGGSYDFTTKILTPPAGGWTQAFPSGSDPVYIVTTIATVVGTNGVILVLLGLLLLKWLKMALQEHQLILYFKDHLHNQVHLQVHLGFLLVGMMMLLLPLVLLYCGRLLVLNL